ncbi:interferon-induced GTP-binding protein [Trichophyton mentagrophytes]|nr:interferon-induced GTP-binding protein [Trichophyton mentagrophytes]
MTLKNTDAGKLGDPVLLNKIDQLFACGVGEYVDLPQLVVVGDQSSGWKAELEALKAESFSKIMAEVHEVMELSGRNKLSDKRTFSNDVLRLEICGPDEDHLGVIDVPGIFKGVTTKADINMEIVEMARELDPNGDRTLGVLTKPDLVDKGAESVVIDMINGKRSGNKVQWSVVRNPEQQDLRNQNTDPGPIFKQRAFLINLVERFQKVMSYAMAANYGADNIFDKPEQRIATEVARRSDIFSEQMEKWGHKCQFEYQANVTDLPIKYAPSPTPAPPAPPRPRLKNAIPPDDEDERGEEDEGGEPKN